MEEKINLVELLKDCPKGMELDCVMYDNVSFVRVEDNDKYPIVIKTKSGFITKLTKYGHNILTDDGKCVIFPKGKTTWEGFHRPFKDGDIVACDCSDGNSQLFIFKEYDDDSNTICYLFLDTDGTMDIDESAWMIDRLATEEEKQKLFQAIKDSGYKWNSETKTLEKIKFENGDVVVTNLGSIAIISNKLNNEFYETHFLLYGLNMIRNVCTCVERLATEEEKQKLFQAIKDNGYKWNSETKTLEKLFEPKFKVGDKIRLKNNRHITAVIVDITENQYVLSSCAQTYLDFKYQDKFELVPDKFDFSTLIPFESQVLVRDNDNSQWKPAFWGYLISNCNFETTRGLYFQCIPYKGNEHLMGKIANCDDFYKL